MIIHTNSDSLSYLSYLAEETYGDHYCSSLFGSHPVEGVQFLFASAQRLRYIFLKTKQAVALDSFIM